MTAKTDLLPCPFCGSENIDPKGWTSTDSAGPACDDCGASAGGVSGTLQDNIARWNARANVAHATAARDAEVEALRAEVVAHGFYDPVTGAYSESQHTPRWLPAVVCTAPQSAPVAADWITGDGLQGIKAEAHFLTQHKEEAVQRAGKRLLDRADKIIAALYQPPSAPVGVEAFESRLRGRAGPFTAQPGERYIEADIALAILRESLAQQFLAAAAKDAEAEARAKQLVEALQEARQMIRDLLPDMTFTKWDALLRDQEEGHEHLP